MTRGHPGLRIHQNSRIQPHIIGVLLHEFLPPCFFDIVLQLDTQRAVVPGISQAAVNLRARIYEPAVFAQVHNFFHRLFGCFHPRITSVSRRWLRHCFWVFAFFKNTMGMAPAQGKTPFFRKGIAAPAFSPFFWYFLPKKFLKKPKNLLAFSPFSMYNNKAVSVWTFSSAGRAFA